MDSLVKFGRSRCKLNICMMICCLFISYAENMVFGQKTRDLDLIPELITFTCYNFQRAVLVGCLQMNKVKWNGITQKR